jgi:hypothetical protein
MKPVVILLASSTIVALAIAVWFLFGPGSRPATPIPPPEKPAMIDAYDRLLAAYKAKQAGQAIDVNLDPFPEDALDIIAGYEQLLARVNQAVNSSSNRYATSALFVEPKKWTDEEREAIKNFLAANQELIEEIRQMAERGGPVYPLDFSEGLKMESPHLARLRQVGRLLHADAVAHGAKGNHRTALQDIIAGMKLGDALALEPAYISQLVRIGIYGAMYGAVQDSFGAGELSPELAQKLVRQIAEADNREALAESLRSELYVVATIEFPKMEHGDWSGFEGELEEETADADAIEESFERSFMGIVYGPFVRKNQKSHIDLMTRLISAAEVPYHQALPELDLMWKDLDELSFVHVFTKILIPALTRSCGAQARHEAVLDLMQLGLLLEQYKAENGSYPAKLDGIATDLGGSVPVDPFTGEAYHYQPSEDDFLLYSVGRNLVDDGGKHDYREGDIVWRGDQKKAHEAGPVGGE